MEYLIPKNNLSDFKAKILSWMENIYYEKYYHKLKKWIFKYLKLCDDYYQSHTSLNKLIKKYFRNSKRTFYLLARKIINSYRNNNYWLLRYKSTKPHVIHYQFPVTIKQQICNYYYDYKLMGAGGILSLYHNIHQGDIHDIDKNLVPKSINTFYRWIRQDKRFKLIKEQLKRSKRYFRRYEVSDIGLLQMDAKVFTDNNFPIKDKRLYVYDFIDEKTRIAFGYVYEYLGVENAVNAVSRAIVDFKALGINIKRIRTDNGAEFTTVFRKNGTYINPIRQRAFTSFLNNRNINHELTPIRSPQSNGKIERFHRNYKSIFWFKKQMDVKLDQNLLQHYLNEWYLFYNFQRRHKSLNFKTPLQVLTDFIKT